MRPTWLMTPQGYHPGGGKKSKKGEAHSPLPFLLLVLNAKLLQQDHLPRLHKISCLAPVEVDAAGDLITGVVLPRHLSSAGETVVRFCGKEFDRYQTI